MAENETKKTKITARQKKAIAAILQTGNMTKAAAAADVNRSTIYRWMDEPLFTAELQAAQGAALGQATCQFIAKLTQALDRLEATAKDESIPASVQLRANLAIIDQAVKYYSVTALEARLTELDNRVNEILEGQKAPRI